MKIQQKAGVLTLVATTAFILGGCGTQPSDEAVTEAVDSVVAAAETTAAEVAEAPEAAMAAIGDAADATTDATTDAAAAVAGDVRDAVAALGSDAPDSEQTREETMRRFNEARARAQAEMTDEVSGLQAELADRARTEAQDAAAAVANVIGAAAPVAGGAADRAGGAVNQLIANTGPTGSTGAPAANAAPAGTGSDVQAAQRAAQEAAEARREAKRAARDARRSGTNGADAPVFTAPAAAAPAGAAAAIVEDAADAASSVIDSGAREASAAVAELATPVTRQDPARRTNPVGLSPQTLEFGDIALGEAREGTVKLINTSDKPYTLIDCRASCGCTTTVCPKGQVIEPGDFVEVVIQLDAGEKPTTLNKTVTFLISDGHPPLRLGLKAEAIAFVTASPESLSRSEAESARIELSSIDGKPFSVESMFPAVLSPEELASDPAPTQVLEFTWDQLIAAGGRSRRLLIRVNHPETTSVLVPISAELLREMRGVAVARGEAAREPAGAPVRDLNALLSANETEAILELIGEGGVEIGVKDRSGHTPMIKAARFGNVEVMNELADRGGDLEAADGMGRTPLSYAAQSRNIEAVNLLLDLGANVHHVDQTGNTPLGWAAGFGTAGMVEAMLEAGARVDTGSGGLIGFTPLIWAASVGTDPKKVELLINAGADLEAIDTMEKASVVLHAIRTNKMKHVELLVNAGARLTRTDTNGGTALHVAARSAAPDLAMMRYLLDKGLDPNARTNPTADAPNGETPLDLARKRKDPRAREIIGILLPITDKATGG